MEPAPALDSSISSFICSTFKQNLCTLSHHHLGHLHLNKSLFMLNSGLLKNKVPLSMSQIDFTCASCNQGKGKTLSFPLHIDNSQACFDLIHTNVWGISPAVSHLGYRNYVIFIDDYSRFTWVYFIHTKSDVFIVFTQFLTMVEN